MRNYVNQNRDRAVITFVIPAYNAELTLERTLNSVLRQSDDRYRILLIDDGEISAENPIFFSGKQRTWRRQKYRAETGGDGVRLLS